MLRSVSRLAPAHRDPLWWALLALWVLNDHVLKASPLAGFWTGKLSDLAGLYVLPAGLACLAGAVAHRRKASLRPVSLAMTAGIYAAVALYFVGLQLSPGVLAASHTTLAAMGVPSRITPDPGDLWALLALALSFFRYAPAPSAKAQVLPKPRPRPALKLAMALPGYAVMLMATVATSRIDIGDGLTQTGRVFLHNATKVQQRAELMQLRADVSIDCSHMVSNPHEYLRAGLFEVGSTLVLEPGDVLALDAQAEPVDDEDNVPEDGGCQALILRGENREPRLLFWKSDYLTLRPLGDTQNDLRSNGVIALRETEPGPEVDQAQEPGFPLEYHQEGEVRILYPVLEEAVPQARPECESPPTATSIEWDEPFPEVTMLLTQLSEGADGCLALYLKNPEQPNGTVVRRYLCVPAEAFPFEPNTLLQFRSFEGESAAVGDSIEGWRIAPPEPEPELEFWAVRGKGLPEIGELLFATQPRLLCDFAQTTQACATLTRPLDITVNQAPSFQGAVPNLQTQALLPGDTSQTSVLRPEDESLSFDLIESGQRVTLKLLRAQEHSVVDRSCSDKQTNIGRDIHLIATWRRIAP